MKTHLKLLRVRVNLLMRTGSVSKRALLNHKQKAKSNLKKKRNKRQSLFSLLPCKNNDQTQSAIKSKPLVKARKSGGLSQS